MTPADFHFELPPELIAQEPPAERSASRMLVVDRAAGSIHDAGFQDFPSFAGPGDALVLNNTRVLPARLFGRRGGGAQASLQAPTAQIEALLLEQLSSEPMRWEALVRPGRKIRPGELLEFPGGLRARVIERGERGVRILDFEPAEQFFEIVDRIGHMPLPPYIHRADESADRERYQTVYAKRRGSAAAPTAGLHFTPEILDAVRARGARTAEVTLHVGLGTFQMMDDDVEVESHRLHAESFEVSAETAAVVQGASRVIAVGTTTVRTLEHAARQGSGRVEACSGKTDLFIYPGFRFQAVGAMLTNFHLPGSSLLMLVCAFAGKELALAAYRHAVERRYRFFSYGDCMLIV